MTGHRSHGRLPAWGLFVAVAAMLAVVLGWASTAAAHPAHPAHAVAPGAPVIPAAPSAPAAPIHHCQWRVTQGSDFGTVDLICGGSVTDPDTVTADHVPPLPAGCESQRDENTGDSPAVDGPRPSTVRCARPGMEWIHCQDEHDFWVDDQAHVQIPQNAPDWWKQEIRIESADAVDPLSGRSDGDQGRGCQLARRAPQLLCSQHNLAEYHAPGLLPDQCWGTFPTSNYAIGWDDGGPFDFENKMQGWTGSFMFNLGKGAVLTALWLTGWAFSFNITEYTRFAANLAERYRDNIVGPFGLEDIMWFTLIVWAGFTTLRGKIGMAGGEIMVAIILAGVATVLFTNRVDYMNNVSHLMDETSARLLAASQTERCVPTSMVPSGSRQLGRANCEDGEVRVRMDPRRTVNLRDEVRPLQRRIHQAFIEQPYSYLNWGRITTGPCLRAQNEIIAVGFNADGWPERHMRRARCDHEANFSRDSTGERMLGAFLTMAAALVVSFLLGLMALTVVLSKFLVALLFAIMPFAALAGTLPGGARRLAWSWASALLQLVVAVTAMSFLLALLMVAVDEILGATDGLGLVERWFIVLLIVSAVYFARKKLISGSKSLGENLANSLTRLTPAGALSTTGNWGGFDLNGIDRGAGGAARGAAIAGAYGVVGAGMVAGGAAGIAARTVVVRRAEARVARRSLRNLFEVQRSYRGWDGLKLSEHGPRVGGSPLPLPGLGGPGSPVPSPSPLPSGTPASVVRGGVVMGGTSGGGAAAAAGGRPAFMLERGVPGNLNIDDRRQMWGFLRDTEHIEPVWDRGLSRFTRPFMARSERRMHQRYLRNQQEQTRQYLGAFRSLRPDIRDTDRLVDRRGRPFGWP
jgi:hypothetical protein